MITKYGELKGVEEAEFYPNGQIRSCKVTEPQVFKTAIGDLIPQYETKDDRRKMTGTVEFYENGDLMAISLDEQIKLSTESGIIPAEKILFYEGEKIKRIFPLNGKLSGYWGEDNEYKLAEEINLNFGDKEVKSKFISIAFYENQKVKSLTLWPKERMSLNTHLGTINIRKGISFYENMNIKSFEPTAEIMVPTPIGNINAFNNEITGLNGDVNSIQFFENGKIKSLFTCNSKIKITEGRNIKTLASELKPGWCNELVKIPVAIKIDFAGELVIFNEKEAYNIRKCNFEINKGGLVKIVEELVC